jgi:hypothetical protein
MNWRDDDTGSVEPFAPTAQLGRQFLQMLS